MSQAREGPARERRVTVMMTDAEVLEVDDARYALRKPTQAETIRFLIKKGLEVVAHEASTAS
ncbi:MAG: hypothetical protein ABII76_27250 [Pseudomonadota bacterium]